MIDKQKTKTNEPNTLKFDISGTGNLKLLELPPFELPNGFEKYDPKTDEQINRSGKIGGTKKAEYLLIPRIAGAREIPAIEFSYFDPETKSYKTIRSKSFNVEIEQGQGGADDYADQQARRVFDLYFNLIDDRPAVCGGKYRINLLPTTVHVYFGKVTGATPDGRLASEPVSEGISPVQGMDRKGPTAVIKSEGKLDHIKTGGTLLNQKFTPQLLADDEGLEKLKDLIRSYFRLMGHHIQFNVVTAETLRDAQKHPEKYRDLIVRVAGYSDYFVDCAKELQDEIIRRTEHESF